MASPESDVTLCVLMQAGAQCECKREPLYLRLSVNGVLQADVTSKRIAGLDDLFIVMVKLPAGVRNIAMLQMGTSKRGDMLQLAPNNHIVDIERDTLLLMRWGKQLQQLRLYPGKQLLFILPEPGNSRVAVQGSIRQLSCWKDALDLYSFHIPSTGTLVAIPIQRRKRSIAFKLVQLPESARSWSDGMEWEQPLHKNKTVYLAENTDADVIVSRWNDKAVHKTEVSVSTRGYKIREEDTVMQSIFEDTAEMYKCINTDVTQAAEGDAKAGDDGEPSDDVTEDVVAERGQHEDVVGGDILSFACSTGSLVEREEVLSVNDAPVTTKTSDHTALAAMSDDVMTMSIHGDTMQKAANENAADPAMDFPDESRTMATDACATMLPAVSATMSAPVSNVCMSVSANDASNTMPSGSTDASTDPGTVKRKKSSRLKKFANKKVMLWLLQKH